MKKTVAVPTLLSIALLLGGCAASSAPSVTTAAPPVTASPAQDTATPATPTAAAAPETAEEWAERIKQATSTKIVVITEDNDPNNLIGRPNGYTDAAVIYDENANCTDLGAGCGVTIEMWPSRADAQQRSDYIQGILKETPAFGTEYHSVNYNVLLRITGELKPSVAEGYQAAFGS